MFYYITLFWLSYALLLGAFLSQIKFKIVWILGSLVLLGALSNVVVVKCNGGQMPVFFSTTEISLEEKQAIEHDPKHVLATAATKLPLLADRIEIEKFQTIYSVGDLMLLLAFSAFAVFITWQLRKINKNFFKNGTQISYGIMSIGLVAGVAASRIAKALLQ